MKETSVHSQENGTVGGCKQLCLSVFVVDIQRHTAVKMNLEVLVVLVRHKTLADDLSYSDDFH